MGSSNARRLIQWVAGLLLALPAISAQAECQPGTLEMRWPGGTARFAVEVADTEALRAKGLMYRETMPSAAGMLFVYQQPKQVAFWMKNTLIPLDMLFADAQGRVTRIHSNAIPHDETAIDGGKSVQFVLEINGGLAKRLGIPEGAEMRHSVIDQSSWSCNAD